MSPVTGESKTRTGHEPRVLVVDDEPNLVEVICDVVRGEVDCKLLVASNLSEARAIINHETIDVLVTDVHLPDGDGMSLLDDLREKQPTASAIVITGSPSLDRAVSALRGGAIDFVAKPFTNAQLVERVRSAIERHSQKAKRDVRIDRLRDAVRRLNDSRKHISKKVDLLCNDLVSAYGELSQKLDDLRSKDGFRNFIAKATDLEQLLCHSMDWLLREIGYSNVAVFLAADDGVFQLGAYMKYTTAGEELLTGALRRVVIPMAVKDAVVRVRAQNLGDRLTPQEMALLKGNDLLAVNCTYLGESLACIIFFRDERSAFAEADMELLKQISPVFAVELATIVREADPDAGESPFFEGDTETEEEDDRPKRRRKKDAADWWKNGEAPPF